MTDRNSRIRRTDRRLRDRPDDAERPRPPSRAADAIIDDPMAIRLRDAFTTTTAWTTASSAAAAREMALRSLAPTGAPSNTCAPIRRPPSWRSPSLQTSFWRLDKAVPDAQFRWVSVDLPPVIELRTTVARLRPHHQHRPVRPRLQLDGPVAHLRGVLKITAEGPADIPAARQAMDLIASAPKRFPVAKCSSTCRRRF